MYFPYGPSPSGDFSFCPCSLSKSIIGSGPLSEASQSPKERRPSRMHSLLVEQVDDRVDHMEELVQMKKRGAAQAAACIGIGA